MYIYIIRASIVDVMGIRYMGHLIDSNKWANTIYLSKYSNKRIAVDTNLFLYKLYYQYGNIIDGLFLLMNKLSKYRITPIFVFDGRPPKEKEVVLAKRRRRRDIIRERYEEMKVKMCEIAENDMEDYLHQMRNLERKMFVVNRDIIEQATKFIELMGHSWIKYECEAEHMCSYLSRENLVDAVMTDDMDALACGAKIVLRGFNTRFDTIQEIRLKDVLDTLEMNLNTFQRLCVMMGTEYGPYETTVITSDNLSQLVDYIKGKENLQIETIIREYEVHNNDFQERIASIMEIFSIKVIELNYEQRKGLWRCSDRDNEKVLEYVKVNGTLLEETIKSRLRYW